MQTADKLERSVSAVSLFFMTGYCLAFYVKKSPNLLCLSYNIHTGYYTRYYYII